MIYFIWDSGTNAIKIGFTAMDVADRMTDLRVGNPNALFLLGTVDGGRDVEAALHARFAELRLSGEWFRVDSMLARFVRKAIDRQAIIRSERGTARTIRAVAWLEERFRVKREWSSVELREAARRDGISKNAMFSGEAMALPIRKCLRFNDRGERLWVAEDGWPIGIAS